MADAKKVQQEHLIPAEINESIAYLKSCKDYTTKEASRHFSRLREATFSNLDPGRKIAKHVGDSGFGLIFPDMFKALLDDKKSSHAPLPKMLDIFINVTNVSADCGMELARFGGIPLLCEAMEQKKIEKRRKDVLQILHNAISLCPGNVTYYRTCNAVSILKGILNGPDQLEQFLSLLILAYVATDLEKKELASTNRGVRLLIKILKKAVKNYPKDAEVGFFVSLCFSAFEILDALNKLAINDDVKNTVAKEDGIPAIVKMLQDKFSPEVQKIAAETVWNLAFVESIRKSEILQSTIPTLKNLTKLEDKEVHSACVSALFEIQGSVANDSGTPSRNTPNTPPPSYQEAISEPAATATDRHVQIMISYQWDSQECAKQIRDNLAAAGYKIWMDVTNMRGDILKAMADAVEESDVILICMTEQYKDSQSCRSEASYAFKLKKKIIPLLLQKDYKPDGWLGLVQGMDLYYSFHSDEGLNENMGQLLKALGEQTRSCGDDVDGPIRSTSQEAQGAVVSASPGKQNKPAAAGWSKEDVQRWLRDNDLTELCEKFRRFGGRHLKMKYEQFCEDKAKFQEVMRSDYSMDDALYTDFIVNLQDAFNE